jgi:hypothetical protein
VKELVASDATAFNGFGASVSVSPEPFGRQLALVGAVINGSGAAGAVYAFDNNGSGGLFQQTQKFVASDSAPDDNFGAAVSLSGLSAAIGASGKATALGGAVGAAYVFGLPSLNPPRAVGPNAGAICIRPCAVVELRLLGGAW